MRKKNIYTTTKSEVNLLATMTSATAVLPSRATDSSSMRPKKTDGGGDLGRDTFIGLQSRISQLKRQIQAARFSSVREKVEKNGVGLKPCTAELLGIASKSDSGPENMLSMRMASPLGKLGWSENGEKDAVNFQEECSSSGALFIVGCSGGKSAVCVNKLPFVEKIPPFTTWIFLDRNQQMAEDQSVVGRRQIYYDDKHGSETLICSDSDEEIPIPEEERHEFSKGEDELLWKTVHEYGLNQHVLNFLSQSIDATSSDIEERYQNLKVKMEVEHAKSSDNSQEVEPNGKQFLDKTLAAALDSLDNLFCRRCLMFDCRLHNSQNLIIPNEKLLSGVDLEESRSPCGLHCYLVRGEAFGEKCCDPNSVALNGMEPILVTNTQDIAISASEDKMLQKDTNALTICDQIHNTVIESILDTEKSFSKRKGSPSESMGCVIYAGNSKELSNKKQKTLSETSNAESQHSESCSAADLTSEAVIKLEDYTLKTSICPGETSNIVDQAVDEVVEAFREKDSVEKQRIDSWSVFEKDLLLKGIEIFGKNSCLISRNMLSGLKTCMEVYWYMFEGKTALTNRTVLTNSIFGDTKFDEYMEQEIAARTRIWRRRGKSKKLKYTWKSTGHPSIRKRIADGKHQSCRQYTPCGCIRTCGKDCPCMHNGTCCEKYCGCSKSCKNRFRGCHCAKSQCRSRQCPCFAAGRECDPDVCRNCWVSCGDGTLGEPPARGDGYQCGNMKLLLKQQQRILLGRSDVAGWGAFIKNPVNKNDYLGEYTGELISHKEADKRGKIYDRTNSSFLFDLNDQYVLDAYRKGNKLKFANHSSNPNCYAKVMLVAGDHRVGIYAKERIEVSEELFYDYRYGPDQAPAWARKPEGSKRDDSHFSHRRAQKVA